MSYLCVPKNSNHTNLTFILKFWLFQESVVNSVGGALANVDWFLLATEVVIFSCTEF